MTPGPQDAPLWAGSDWGKVLLQFRRFSIAAQQRVLLRAGQGLMNGDAVNTTIALTTMGGLALGARVLKDIGQHGEPQGREPGEWVAEAFDGSGIFGMFVELDQTVSKTGIPTPFTALAGRPTRFQEREIFSQLAGPMEDTHKALTSGLSGEFTQADLYKLRKLIPAQNVPGLAALLTEGEERSGLPKQ